MSKITIKGTTIVLPTSGSSPNWAPAIIESIEALADAINSVSATYDVPPQAQNIDLNNPATNLDLNNLSFPSADVRAATIYYTVYRKTANSGPSDGQELTEAGTLEINYNASNPSFQKWEIVRVFQGEGQITFSITDLGQIQFSTNTLPGINHTGIVSYRAISILND